MLTWALYQFKFFPIALLRSLFPPRNRKVDAAKMSYQSDPFFAECRAYGKINGILGKYRRSEARGRRSRLKAHEKVRPKARAQRELAVPCYGFMELPSVPYEQHLLTKYNIDDWNREESDLQLPKERRAPFRAIVKKLMPNTEPIRDPSQMRRDLMDLQKSGIAQNDVALRNYMDGLLVDFSSAWTEPHWAKEVLPMSSWKRQLEDDFLEFDFMMKKADVKLRPLARSLDIYGKLRDRPGTPRADVQKYCGPRKLEAGLVK